MLFFFQLFLRMDRWGTSRPLVTLCAGSFHLHLHGVSGLVHGRDLNHAAILGREDNRMAQISWNVLAMAEFFD